MGNSGCFLRGKSAAIESRYPTYGACWVFHCFHNSPNSDTNYGIFDVRTEVNECDCARGCTDTVRESALKVDSRRKIPCRTGESNLRRQRVGPMIHHLSYIPTHTHNICVQQMSKKTHSIVKQKSAPAAYCVNSAKVNS